MLENLSSLLRAGGAESGSVGITASDSGVSICRVEREGRGKPKLRVCEFRSSESQPDTAMMIRAMVAEHNLENIPCNFVLSQENYQLLLIEAPDVQDAELKAAVRWQIRDMIDFHVDEAAIDVFDVPHQNAQIRNRMMYVVVARAAWISQSVGVFERADLPLEVIDVAELSLRNVASLVEENDEGIVLLHLDADSGVLMVQRESTLFLTRRVKIGYNDIIRAAGDDPDSQSLSNELRHLLDVIVLEVQRSLDYYESHFSQPSVAALYMAPMPRDLPGMASYLSESLETTVRALDLNTLLDTREILSLERQHRCIVAVGAALREETTSL